MASNPEGQPSDAAPAEPEPRAAPLEALGGGSTPLELHFERSHFAFPDSAPGVWSVEVGGAVRSPCTLPLDTLQALGSSSADVVLECAGHRRAELSPAVPGVAWGAGAVSQARWTGTPLGLVLERAGIGPEAVEVVLHGGDGDGTSFARALPLAKALEPSTLLAWAVEGGAIPRELGGPLRAVVPGHYAVDSVKWVRRLELVTEPFRGYFQAQDYCFFGAEGIAEGTPVRELPVSSLITVPAGGSNVVRGPLAVRGVAWGGERIARVELQVDSEPWREAAVEPAVGPHAFTPWSVEVDLEPGDHVLGARATDAAGRSQPDLPIWNARGYGNNSVHRVAISVV